MQSNARDNYLYNEVMTAAPQKLQLMLIEAAIRFGNQAAEQWKSGNNESAGEAILRCQRIMTELLAGVNTKTMPELTRRVAGVYMFIYRSFLEAHLRRDEGKLREALEVLAVEQQTWRSVCEKLGSTVAASDSAEESHSLDQRA